MTQATLLLVDNGSSRAASTLKLRRLASRLGESVGSIVHPVSLQHANKIHPTDLDGIPANTFVPFMKQRLQRGDRRFVVLPLFFGPSRALSSFIPEQAARLASEYGAFELQQCPVLCPLPQGEPRLAQILRDQLPALEQTQRRRVILVDHGSPIPEVTAVRHYLAEQMRRLLSPDIRLYEAVMERREGGDYDFNGELLEQVLRQAAEQDHRSPIALSLLFMSPGRHAGSGGDIESICRRIGDEHPGWPILTSALVGEHPGLISILHDRLAAAMQAYQELQSKQQVVANDFLVRK
jgi:sirohydrochlorin ferrochelatase